MMTVHKVPPSPHQKMMREMDQMGQKERRLVGLSAAAPASGLRPHHLH